MQNGFLDNFNFPGEGTREILKAKGLEPQTLHTHQYGKVEMYMAHDKGVAFRFFIHPEYSEKMSKLLKYEFFNELVLIEYFVDQRTKPVERIHLIPEELLLFEKEITEVPTFDKKDVKEKITYGECIGGQYFEAFKRWKEGVTSPGLPLNKWGVFSDGECATLAARGIFSVEQLAAQPRAKIEGGKLPQVFIDGFERAIQYVNGKINRSGEERLAKQVLELEGAKASNEAALEEMRAEMLAMRKLLTMKEGAPAKKKPGKKPKTVRVEDGVITDEE